MSRNIDQEKFTPERVLSALQTGHVGHQRGVTACALAAIVGDCVPTPGHQRKLRQIIEVLRNHGHQICAHPAHGYFIARDAAELEETCTYLMNRARTSLRQVASMKRVSMQSLQGQLQLDLEPETEGT